MTSLAYLRGERNVKVRTKPDRRMLSTKISELDAQVQLDVVKDVTFEGLKKSTREFSRRLNCCTTAQEILDGC